MNQELSPEQKRRKQMAYLRQLLIGAFGANEIDPSGLKHESRTHNILLVGEERILSGRRLSEDLRLWLAFFVRCRGQEDLLCRFPWPGRNNFEMIIDLSPLQVIQHVKELRTKELLSTKRRSGMTNLYVLKDSPKSWRTLERLLKALSQAKKNDHPKSLD